MYNEWDDPIKEALNKPEPKLKEVVQKTSEQKLTDIGTVSYTHLTLPTNLCV